MNFQFAWPWLLAALPLPLLTAAFLPRAPAPSANALRIPFYSALANATKGKSIVQRSPARLTLASLAWVLLVLAAARPQWVGDPLQLPVSGRDLLLAVDISGSMLTEDMRLDDRQASRLNAVKAVAGNFIEQRQGDRLGLILFGSKAYLQTPLTFDRKTVQSFLDEAAIGLAGKETAIGDAIGLAIKRLRDQSIKNRVLILLTDGANTTGELDPLKAADLAAAEQLRIYTIGVGNDEMLVRTPFGVQRIATGSDLDETTLKTIAKKTGGQYFRARDIKELQSIYRQLDSLEPRAQDEVFRPVNELYLWPLASALILSCVIALLTAGWTPRAARAPEVYHV